MSFGAKKIRVVVIDDSLLFRTMLRDNLNKDPGIEVVGVAGSADEGKKVILETNPDVVTLDNEMPRKTGIQFLEEFLPVKPIPTIIVTATAMDAFSATNAGAVDYIKKPSASEFIGFMKELSSKVKVAAISKVRTRPVARAPLPTSTTPLNGTGGPGYQKSMPSTTPLKPLIASAISSKTVIAIGASTGGTEAILEVVRDLPETTPGIVIVQHMPAGFTQMYAERLNKTCKMRAKEAQDGDRVEQGLIIMGAGEHHLRLLKDARGYYVSSKRGEKVSGHCPSVDVLFDSVADTAGKDAIGVILTGMGADGAKGLKKMKDHGAYTIGQDKDTCVVYGMPAVAFNIGGVTKQMPLEEIDEELIRFLNKGCK